MDSGYGTAESSLRRLARASDPMSGERTDRRVWVLQLVIGWITELTRYKKAELLARNATKNHSLSMLVNKVLRVRATLTLFALQGTHTECQVAMLSTEGCRR